MRILYVEDQPQTARILQKILEQNGYHVALAHTSADAKKLCADKEFDLYLVDLDLPDGHGGDLLRLLQRMADRKAIALTGYALPHQVAEGADDGFDAYLTKPVSVEQLLETIEQLR